MAYKRAWLEMSQTFKYCHWEWWERSQRNRHLSHAEEDDLMSKHVFIVKVGSLCYLGSLVKRAWYDFFILTVNLQIIVLPSYWHTTQLFDYSSNFLCREFEPVFNGISSILGVPQVQTLKWILATPGTGASIAMRHGWKSNYILRKAETQKAVFF